MPLLRDIQLKEEFRSELLREIFSIQEEERRRIARELHDETSQDLASLNANLETALGLLPDGTDRVRDRLKEAQTISISILSEIHKLIYELRPTLLDDLGLGPAIRWLVEVNLETAGIKVDFKTMGKERRLPHQLETTLFRITKEAFSNITKHSHATKVSLVLHCKRNTVIVNIQDNGRGFDVEEAINSKDRPRGLGLLGMKERVELMNGTLNIHSHPDGSGTVIDIEIPLKQEVTGGENKDTGGR